MKRICNMILNITVKKQKGDQAESRIKITHHTKTIRQNRAKKLLNVPLPLLLNISYNQMTNTSLQPIS